MKKACFSMSNGQQAFVYPDILMNDNEWEYMDSKKNHFH